MMFEDSSHATSRTGPGILSVPPSVVPPEAGTATQLSDDSPAA